MSRLRKINKFWSNLVATRIFYAAGVGLLQTIFLLQIPFSDEAFAGGVADPSAPAKIVSIRKNKKGPYLVIDQGSRTGFVIGRDVCFYTADNSKVSCASIVRTKPRASAAYISAEESAKLQQGYFVWPDDLGSLKLQPKVTDEPTDAGESDVNAIVEEEDDPPEPILPPMLKPRFHAHIAPIYALPIWMNDLRFSADARAAGSGEIWESGDTIKGSVVGFGFRYYRPLNGRGDSSFDFTYNFVPQRPVKDDFDATNSSVVVRSSVWSHHYRLRWMRGATWMHRDDSDLLLYTGFGYDYLKAKFLSQKTGAASGELVQGQITGHGLEIPLIVTWQKYFGRWLFSAGADMAMPLGVFGVKSTGSLSYDEQTAEADKSFNGAVDAVNVRRGWFSLGLQFGLGASF